MDYQSVNAAAIDRWAAEGWKWGRPISHERYERAQRGAWDVLLTPSPFDPLANPEQMARREKRLPAGFILVLFRPDGRKSLEFITSVC